MSKRSKDSQETFNRIAAAPSKYTDTRYGRRIKRPYVQDHFIKRAYVWKIADCEPATSRKPRKKGKKNINFKKGNLRPLPLKEPL